MCVQITAIKWYLVQLSILMGIKIPIWSWYFGVLLQKEFFLRRESQNYTKKHAGQQSQGSSQEVGD